MRTPRYLAAVCLATALLSAGCLQVEVSIRMQEDGAATINERVRFSQSLMELDEHAPPGLQLRRLLEKSSIEERVKNMGAGATLVSHRVSDLPDGARESVAVFKIPDVEDLRLVNPLLGQGDPNRLMLLHYRPIYKVVNSYERVGDLILTLEPAEKPRRGEAPATQGDESGGRPPVDLQMLRNLGPMFADLMAGFELKLRVIETKPIYVGYVRNKQAGTKVIDLLSFTDRDLDAYGGRFIQNEELMLCLMRLQLDAPIIADHVEGFAGNQTVPVFRCKKPYGSARFQVLPTQHQFQKYFHGRPKSQGGDAEG